MTRRATWLAVVVGATLGCKSPKPPAAVPPLPHAAYAHYLEGKHAGYRDDWAGAVDSLTRALAAAPDQPMIAVELARAQHKAKRDDAARATLAMARKKWPKHPQVWLASGDMLASVSAPEAIRAYRRAIELEPTDEHAYLGLAKLEPPPAALLTLKRLVAKVPESIDGRYRLAKRLAETRDLAGAVPHLRFVLERDPDHIDARIDLARALRMLGKLDDAVAQTRSAFDRSGQALDMAEELFYVLCEADDISAAIDLLTLLDDDRSDVEALGIVARLHRGLGQLDASRDIGKKVVKVEPDAGALILAETELAAGDPAAAAKRALAIAPTSERFLEARRVAAAAFFALQDPKRALEAIAPARAAKPTSVELATVAAFALVELGKLADARALIAGLGDKPAVRFALARVIDHAGDRRGALAIVEPLAKANPNMGSAHNLAGYLLADGNERLADAERYLVRARELSPGDPAVLDSWGWLLHRQGKSRAAVRALDHAARLAPREPEILVHLAAAWAADGAPRTALVTLDRAAALRPPPAIQKKLDAVRAVIARRPTS